MRIENLMLCLAAGILLSVILAIVKTELQIRNKKK